MTSAALPVLFAGNRAGNALLAVDVGTSDGGQPYTALATTNRVAPGGPSGEAVFTALAITVTTQDALTLRVTPLIDGYAGQAQRLEIPASGRRTTAVYELALTDIILDESSAEFARVYPRGCWLQVKLETDPSTPAAGATIEGVDVEYDIVRESRSPMGIPS